MSGVSGKVRKCLVSMVSVVESEGVNSVMSV